VGLVEDPASGGEEAGERPGPDEVRPGVAGPPLEGGVDLDDGAVDERREVPAGGVLVQVPGVVVDERREEGVVRAVADLLAQMEAFVSSTAMGSRERTGGRYNGAVPTTDGEAGEPGDGGRTRPTFLTIEAKAALVVWLAVTLVLVFTYALVLLLV
jgi:hypothetical protein